MSQSAFARGVNSVVRFLLRSPLHRKLSKSIVLIGYRGRRTGKAYLTPANYVRMDGVLSVLSNRERLWWRNLRGLPQASLVLRGRRLQARPRVLEDRTEVIAALDAHLRRVPWLARTLGVGMAGDGQWNAEDLDRIAERTVVILFELPT